MIVGIVGSEHVKFGANAMVQAFEHLRRIIGDPKVTGVSSGHCHLGGIDVWAEEVAKDYGKFDPKLIFPPKYPSWEAGYKPRNIQIAEASDIVYCIVPDKLPSDYKGMRFECCYHCRRHVEPSTNHVKSGGCWTMHYAREIDKRGELIIVRQEG